jgi:2-polyprenyl-6-methoxyphenol hydroxylase-like FAD-dependent oxidoreductase
MRIALIGGGIAGLTTALALARAGLRATVYEAVADPRPLGVGINLLPHAVRELTEMGLLPELEALGVPIDALVYRMVDGREVWREPRGRAAGYHWPQIAIHRGRFQSLLRARVLQELGAEAIRDGHALASFRDQEGSVELNFVDRASGRAVASVSAEVVIGADGIHSAVRRRLYPHEGLPKWNGITLFRGTTLLPPGSVGGQMHWTGHSRQKFVGYPIAIEPGGQVLFNWICDLATAEPGSTPREDWNRRVDPSVWLDRYAGWAWDGIDVVSIVRRAAAVFEFPMIDRDPLPRWTHGGVTLIGDAAHPMYPIGSNGATQSILDARVLALHLATAPDAPSALARYEQERRESTTRIVLMNRAHGPDRVLEIARERCGAAGNLESLFPYQERAEIAATYKKIAGFDPAVINNRASFSVPGAHAV